MANVIELNQVCKFYGSKPALQNVSLNIPVGITGLLGPNGSGKSTLIKALMGLLRLNSGTASVLGHSLPKAMRVIRDIVGYMPEDDCFISGLTGIESVQFMARLSGLPFQEGLRRSHEILDFSDIGGERYRAVETYSTGMRQKLKFAQALVHDPQLLILDEPTTGLDPSQRVSMLRRIRSLSTVHGKSVLLSTHILHDVREICEHVVILSTGQVKVVERLDVLSRPSQPGLQVHVLERAEQLASRLESQGIRVTRESDTSLWIHGMEAEQSSDLWRIAGECQVTLSRLQPAMHSLEQIFIESVRDAHHATL